MRLRSTPLRLAAAGLLLTAVAPHVNATAARPMVEGPVAGPQMRVPANVNYKVIGHNVERKQAAIDAALDEASTYNAQVILLQEVCSYQASAIALAHALEWTVVFNPVGVHNVNGPKVCPNTVNPDEPYPDGDVAIWTGGTTGVGHVYPFVQQDEDRGNVNMGLTCVFFGSPQIRACSTHITAAGVNLRENQVEEIYTRTKPWITDGRPVILGGDFNLYPTRDQMDYIYEYDPADADAIDDGQFREAATYMGHDCRCGAVTTEKDDPNDDVKIDHVFFSKNVLSYTGTRTYNVYAKNFTPSDHRLVRATAILNLP